MPADRIAGAVQVHLPLMIWSFRLFTQRGAVVTARSAADGARSLFGVLDLPTGTSSPGSLVLLF